MASSDPLKTGLWNYFSSWRDPAHCGKWAFAILQFSFFNSCLVHHFPAQWDKVRCKKHNRAFYHIFMAFPWITCKTSNQKCLRYIKYLLLSSTYHQRPRTLAQTQSILSLYLSQPNNPLTHIIYFFSQTQYFHMCAHKKGMNTIWFMTIYIYYVTCEFTINFLPKLYKIPSSVTGTVYVRHMLLSRKCLDIAFRSNNRPENIWTSSYHWTCICSSY